MEKVTRDEKDYMYSKVARKAVGVLYACASSGVVPLKRDALLLSGILAQVDAARLRDGY